MRKLFPKLKIIARDGIIRINGDEQENESFSQLFTSMLMFFDNYGRLDEDDIRKLAGNGNAGEVISTFREANADVLVHGKNGMMIRARTINQEQMVKSIAENDMIFAIGPAGTGKTYTAVALAVRALKNKEVRRIVLTRPAVEAGENLGFLPGDLKDKLDPYLQPLYDALHNDPKRETGRLPRRRNHRNSTFGIYARTYPGKCLCYPRRSPKLHRRAA